jgi:AcrR family transcriptional regulator
VKTTEHRDRRSVSGPSVSSADVLDAALTVFAERGYHGTSLKDVAVLLEIRTPSLYNHMESKASLLSEIILGTLSQVRQDFAEAVDGVQDPVERLRRATYVYARRHAVNRREALVVNQDSTHLEEADREWVLKQRREHEREFRQIIIDGLTAGIFSVPSPKLASFAILEMCVSIARWFRRDGQLSPEEVAQEYAVLALNLVGFRSSEA